MARVIWAETALNDLREITAYVADKSPRNAEKLRGRLVGAPRVLARFPHYGAKVPEYDREDIREIYSRPYRIIYLVRGNACRVVRLVHGSRNLQSLLRMETLEDL